MRFHRIGVHSLLCGLQFVLGTPLQKDGFMFSADHASL